MSSLSFSAWKLSGNPRVSIESDRLFMFPGPLAWAFVGFVITLDVFFLVTRNFSIEAGPIWPVLALAVISFFVALFIQRQYPKVAMVAFTVAFFVVLGKSIRVLNYLTTSFSNTFITSELEKIDNYLEFNWYQYLEYINNSPVLLKILPLSYDTLSFTTVATIYILIVMRQYENLREFLILFFGLAFVTTCIGWFFPVQDTFSYYNPSFGMRSNIRASAGVFHLPHFTPLRNGTMQYINLSDMVGMVQFPSFHTIAGLLIIWVTRGSLMIIPMAVINLTMIVSAIVYGGHYLIDIIVSALLTVLAISIYHTCRSGKVWQKWKKTTQENKTLSPYHSG